MDTADPEKLSNEASIHKSDSYKADEIVYVEPADEGKIPKGNLQRQMKNRHIQMMAIGAVIGTGLFVGSAGLLGSGGPCALFVSYVVISALCWAVMVSVGETAAHLPVPGAMVTHAQVFVDDSLSFTHGWLYCIFFFFTLCAELSACATLIHFWTDANYAAGSTERQASFNAVWITIFILFNLAINVCRPSVYGELEATVCAFKIILIIGWIILGIILAAGGGPSGETIGFEYWRHPGPFVQYLGLDGAKGRFLGFWYVCCQASFAFLGSELCIMASAEVKNPKKVIPRAVKSVYIRIILFYILSIFFVSMLVRSDDEHLKGESTGAKSPMVIAIRAAGIQSLPSIVNAVILSSALSSGTAQTFGGSRALYALALNGRAPRFFKKVTKEGVPIFCVLAYVILACITYMVCSDSSSTIFGYFVNLTSISGMMNWIIIFIVYLRFHYAMRVQHFDRSVLPYRGPFQPYTAIGGLIFAITIVITNGFTVFLNGQWDTPTFVTSYFPFAFSIFLYVSHKIFRRGWFVNLKTMNLWAGSYADDYEEGVQTDEKESFGKKFLRGIIE